ncbi:cytochrome oxidase assembly protein-domain-containing protein [Fimicolochytrium jonesii]|uniref:cytochrome oxidase assembly protein-domain-containing protein n=1 Tax=Fimicolochytrium jonesii TaxID=1396493 RepID=UPI0022FEB422|nr:cytochrome oxidase assembly protein-domain-containing protein [Fimicolochytrium jonesii]KAI8820826.1 cytochrome oxidase assembly protein-domain-containing protein [Fimicolochytrium jonesii]
MAQRIPSFVSAARSVVAATSPPSRIYCSASPSLFFPSGFCAATVGKSCSAGARFFSSKRPAQVASVLLRQRQYVADHSLPSLSIVSGLSGSIAWRGNPPARGVATTVTPDAASPISNTTATTAPQPSTTSSNHHDANSNPGEEQTVSKPIVGYWYLFCGSLVFGIVALGGFTRLTESGLSIVEWNLIKGMKPPRTQEEWEEEFEKYKQFPEFKLMNHRMTLPEFKFIFYMEWAHRMVGRFIGLSFIIPGAYFAYKGYMSKTIRNRSLLVATLIGAQGLLGWLMVRSGLSPELMETAHAVPRVSHYWLTAHLGSAFTIYSIMLVTGLDILRANRVKASVAVENSVKAALATVDVRRFAKYSRAVAGLVFLTALSGGLVAGLDAGLIYNEFPQMGEGLVPSDMWAYSTQTDRNPNPLPWWRNLLENPAAVQFNHRVMAMTTATTILTLFLASRRFTLPRTPRLATNALLAMVGVQATLGICTLLYFVPTPLAAAHQSGSLTLLSVALWLMQSLRYVRR